VIKKWVFDRKKEWKFLFLKNCSTEKLRRILETTTKECKLKKFDFIDFFLRIARLNFFKNEFLRGLFGGNFHVLCCYPNVR